MRFLQCIKSKVEIGMKVYSKCFLYCPARSIQTLNGILWHFFDFYRLCNPLSDNDDDISNFAISIAGNFMGVVQYNKDNRKFEVWHYLPSEMTGWVMRVAMAFSPLIFKHWLEELLLTWNPTYQIWLNFFSGICLY